MNVRYVAAGAAALLCVGAGAVAGRSPSYLVRQLYDMQAGTRHGPTVAPMRPVVAKLTVANMVDIAACVSSQEP